MILIGHNFSYGMDDETKYNGFVVPIDQPEDNIVIAHIDIKTESIPDEDFESTWFDMNFCFKNTSGKDIFTVQNNLIFNYDGADLNYFINKYDISTVNKCEFYPTEPSGHLTAFRKNNIWELRFIFDANVFTGESYYGDEFFLKFDVSDDKFTSFREQIKDATHSIYNLERELTIGDKITINSVNNGNLIKYNQTEFSKFVKTIHNPKLISSKLIDGVEINGLDIRGTTPLIQAVSENFNPAVIIEIIRLGAKYIPEALKDSEMTPLVVAAGNNPNPDILDILLKYFGDIISYDEICRALKMAVRASICFQSVKILLNLVQDFRSLKNCADILNDAVSGGNVEIVKLLIEAGADVNAYGEFGMAPILQAASIEGKAEVLRYLLEHGADPDTWDRDNEFAAIHLAAYNEDPDVLKVLLSNGAKVNVKNKRGETALHGAVRFDPRAKKLEMLLSAGCNPNDKNNNGESPLHILASNDKIGDEISLLLAKGADANLSDSSGITPLMKACRYGSLKSVEIFVNGGANLAQKDANQATALHFAALDAFRKDNKVSLLIKAGSEIDSRDNNGRTPLHYAACCGNLQSAKSLIKAGADKEARDNEGKTPLNLAVMSQNNPGIIWMLGEEFLCDINSVDNYGYSVLMNACWFGQGKEIVNALIRLGADVHKKLEDGSTAILCAAAKCKPEIIDILLDHGCNINETAGGGEYTLLMAAAHHQEYDFGMFSYLVDKGLDVNYINKIHGMSPIVYAVYNNRKAEIIKKLINLGADLSIKWRDADLLMIAAASNFHKGVTWEILEHSERSILNPNRKNKNGVTPFLTSLQFNVLDVSRVLLEFGADIKSVDLNGFGAMHYAACSDKGTRTLKFLIERGMDINSLSYNGRTPLMCAVAVANNTDNVITLLDAGADTSIRDNDGMSLHQYAMSNKFKEIEKLCRDRGLFNE